MIDEKIKFRQLIINKLNNKSTQLFIIITTIYAKFLFKLMGVNYGRNLVVRGWIRLKNMGNIVIGDNCTIESRENNVGFNTYTMIRVGRNADLIIGDNVGIANTHIHCYKSITIMDNAGLGGGCELMDTNFHELYYQDRKDKKGNIIKCPIIIGRGVFVGSSCIILKGVTIGDYSIIGSGSVVTKNIGGGEVWGGNPANMIRKSL